MMWLIPSSMRFTTTVSGVRVVMARNANVAIANTKAIGAPASTPAATSKYKEHHKLVVAHRDEQGLEHPQAGTDRRDDQQCENDLPKTAHAREPQQREDQHQRATDRNSGCAPDIRDFHAQA